jgi:DNA-binding NarL/FixJ family response regulator
MMTDGNSDAPGRRGTASPDSRHAVEILLVAEHIIVREGLRRLLEDEPDLTVVGEAETPAAAVAAAATLTPDIILTGFAGSTLADLLEQLDKLDVPDYKADVVVLGTGTQVAGQPPVGSHAVLPSESPAHVLFERIRSRAARRIAAKGRAVPEVEESANGGPAGTGRRSERTRFGLTPREMEIVAAVRRGIGNKAIAKQCSISEDTVKHHLTHIFAKVGVSSRVELAVFAIQKGIE